MPIEVLAHFSSQLPLLIRGVLFENWRPSESPIKERKRADFISEIEDILLDLKYHNLNPETAAVAVFDTLSYKISIGEIDKLQKILPKDIRAIFNEI